MANTSAPLSDTAIANMAGQMLGESEIVSLDDATSPVARFLRREFGYVRDELLRLYPWSFAISREQLGALEDAPSFGWRYAYLLPSTCIRVLELRCGGAFGGGGHTPYEVEGRQILTDAPPPLAVRFITRVTNPALFDPLFARLLAARLAMYAAQRITGKSSYADRARAVYEDTLQEAMHSDSLARGSQENVMSPGGIASVIGVRGV